MRILLALAITAITSLTSCTEKTPSVPLIPLTTTSSEAESLLREAIINWENRQLHLNEGLFSQIFKLDKNFVMAKILEKWPPSDETFEYARKNFKNITDYEVKYIKVLNKFMSYDVKAASGLNDILIMEHPQYYEPRLLSAFLKRALGDAEGAQSRYLEVIDINPYSFIAHIDLASLHFDKQQAGAAGKQKESILPIDQRNLEFAEELLKRAQKIDPDSHLPKVDLGNLYLSKGDLKKSRKIFEESLNLLTNIKGDEYISILSRLGIAAMFDENYEEARNYFQQASSSHVFTKGAGIGEYLPKFTCLYNIALTHIFERKYESAVIAIDLALQTIIDDEIGTGDSDWLRSDLELLKFQALSHALQNEESLKSLESYEQLSHSGSLIMMAGNSNEVDLSQPKQEWLEIIHKYNRISRFIVLSDFDSARENLDLFLSQHINSLEQGLGSGKNNYYKLVGQLYLMEGNASASIEAYSKVEQTQLEVDPYHKYFFALANKSVGNLPESKRIFKSISDYYTESWELAFVRNLAKQQLATW